MPLGVYDHDVDPDVPMLRSINVGGSFAAKAAGWGTHMVDKATDFLDKLDPLP